MNVPVQSLPQEIWGLRNTVLHEGLENQSAAAQATPALTKEQIKAIEKQLDQIYSRKDVSGKDREALYQLKKDIGFGDIQKVQYGYDQPAKIITALNQIAKQVFDSSSQRADGSNSQLPLEERLRNALEKAIQSKDANDPNDHEELHQLLTSKEFREADLQTLMILPGVEWGEPNHLIQLFELLIKDFCFQKDNSAAGEATAARGAEAAAAAEGAACGVATVATPEKKMPKMDSKELENFKTQIAHRLAPIFFKNLKKTLFPATSRQENDNLDEQRKLLLNSSLFKSMSLGDFTGKITQFIEDPAPLTPEQGEILLAVIRLKFKEPRLSGEPKAHENQEEEEFLAQEEEEFLAVNLAGKIDIFAPLNEAIEAENQDRIDHILSCQNLLHWAAIDDPAGIRDTLFAKFKALENEKLSSQPPEDVRKLHNFLTHPKWAVLSRNIFEHALIILLHGEPYTSDPSRSWTDDKAVKVNKERLKELLFDPYFENLPYMILEELLRSTTNLNGAYGLPLLDPDTQHMVIRACIQHPRMKRITVNETLLGTYFPESSSGIPLSKNSIPIFKEEALGNPQPLDNFFKKFKEGKKFTAEELTATFDGYAGDLHQATQQAEQLKESQKNKEQAAATNTAVQSPKLRKLKMYAADLLMANFYEALKEAVVQGDKYAVDELLYSDLFLFMDRDQHEPINYEGLKWPADLDEEQKTERKNLLITHPQWMNLGTRKFLTGFEALLKQNPINPDNLVRLETSIHLAQFTRDIPQGTPGDVAIDLSNIGIFDAQDIFHLMGLLIDAKDHLPRESLEIILKACIQNPAIFRHDHRIFYLPGLFIFPNFRSKDPQETIELFPFHYEDPPIKISQELSILARQWMLENFENLELPKKLLLNLAERAVLERKANLLPIFFKRFKVQTEYDFRQIITLLVQAIKSGIKDAIPILIQQIALARQDLSASTPAEIDEPEVKIRASEAAAISAVEASAGRDGGQYSKAAATVARKPRVSREKLLGDYQQLLGLMDPKEETTEGKIDLVIKDPHFRLIAQDMIDSIKGISFIGDREILWLDKLTDAGWIPKEEAGALKSKWAAKEKAFLSSHEADSAFLE